MPRDERARSRVRRYGMTADVFDQLWDSQDRRCALCRRTCKPCVDFSPEESRVRGLLCRRCAFAVGAFRNLTQKTKDRMVGYLEGRNPLL